MACGLPAGERTAGRALPVPALQNLQKAYFADKIRILKLCKKLKTRHFRIAAPEPPRKIHMRIGLQGFLPKFAVVKEASTHDAPMAYEVCASLQSGEIVVFDKAYLDLPHLALLDAGKGSGRLIRHFDF
jgi:hypothetical protein